MIRLEDSEKKWVLDELERLVKIPSVSFPGFDHQNIKDSASATAETLTAAGFENVELLALDPEFPYVVADLITDPKLPTVLLYAHHDVQPEGRQELWKSSPFAPTMKDGRLYGRGTADDKAGIMVHAAALKILNERGLQGKSSLPVNLKLIIEGEEEVGSGSLLPFLKKHEARLKSDVIVVTDTANIETGYPSLTVSLRGLVVVDIEVKTLVAPLHSGMWGGGVIDPTQVLIKMIAGITDDHGNPKLKSLKLESQPHRHMGHLPVDRDNFAHQAGVLHSHSVPEDFFHKIWYEPSFSVNAIQASSERLANNVICDRAFARVGIRVTAHQKAEEVRDELMDKLRSLCPKGVDLKLKDLGASNAWETDTEAPANKWAFDTAIKSLGEAYGQKTTLIGCGGSIPFVSPFEKALKAPVICLGVEDPYTLAHSENESLQVKDFFSSIEAEINFFQNLKRPVG